MIISVVAVEFVVPFIAFQVIVATSTLHLIIPVIAL
jgi:hypothetical protein